MRRLIELIEKNATVKSKTLIRKIELLKSDTTDGKQDYNPKTARYKSLKDFDSIFR